VEEHQVEDAAQQVLIVFSRRTSEVPREAVRSFLLGTALRVASNWRRKGTVAMSDRLARDLVRAGRADASPPGARERALAALGLEGGATGFARAASGAALAALLALVLGGAPPTSQATAPADHATVHGCHRGATLRGRARPACRRRRWRYRCAHRLFGQRRILGAKQRLMSNAIERPKSVTSFAVNLVGPLAALVAMYVLRGMHRSGSDAVFLVCVAGVVPIVLLDVLVLRVHRRETTGLDWKKNASDVARVATKLLGLAATVGPIGLAYFVFPEYGDWYTPFWALLRRFGAGLIACSVAYFWIVDGMMRDP
jgi:hypothetical protein